jgi:hypothetical protein
MSVSSLGIQSADYTRLLRRNNAESERSLHHRGDGQKPSLFHMTVDDVLQENLTTFPFREEISGILSIFWLTVMAKTGLCVTLLVAKSSMFNGKLSYRDM